MQKSELMLMRMVGKEHWWKVALLRRWGEVMGVMAERVVMERVEGDLLVLGVEHPCWAQELMLIADRLLARVNVVVKGRIKRLRFVSHERQRGDVVAQATGQLSVLSVGCRGGRGRLTANEEAELAAVGDSELRALLRAFYEGCKGRADAVRSVGGCDGARGGNGNVRG